MVKKPALCYPDIMLKSFLALTLILFSSNGFSKPKRFMVCLGQEEALIHKNKFGGPVYKLNQEIISSLVQLRDSIYMKDKFVKEVCKANFPSMKVLELLMTEKDVFFSIYTEKRNPKRLAIDESTIEELREKSSLLFVNFVTHMQASLGKPGCMEKHIPELGGFYEKMQYLLEDIGLRRVMDTLKNPRRIFNKLQTLSAKNMKC